jgi:hypothetical protein
MWEQIIIAVIVLACVGMAGRWLYRSLKGKDRCGCASGKTGCTVKDQCPSVGQCEDDLEK